VAGAVLLGAATAALRRPHADAALAEALPAPRPDGPFVTSATCQSCHPVEHATWTASYHRTMTQVATPASVLAPFDGEVLASRGFEWRFGRRGEELWVEMPDPVWFEEPAWLMQLLDASWPDTPPRVAARVVLSTGSHHMQTYWVRRPRASAAPLPPDDGSLVQVPWVWLVDEGRWVPNQDSFLAPPSRSIGGVARWNDNCSQCHSVGTEPRPRPGTGFATRSAELGIACEACHGTAKRHVGHYRSPLRRYLRYLRLARGDDPPDATIVNPAKLDPARTNEACGQCHSFGVWADEEAYLARGYSFMPGDDLRAHRRVFVYEEDAEEPLVRDMLEADSLALRSRFWPDGTSRVAGREYNALIASTHNDRSDLTCLSCHSLHGYEATDAQLLPGSDGDRACLGCHDEYAEATRAAGHARHEIGSSGSACMNCHMPRTTYGLFQAMRSHRIDSPTVSGLAGGGRPNACNLCHLDRTLEWAALRLEDWYGRPPPALDAEERAVAAGPLWALRGDAAIRAITAWHMGWDAAREASGETWTAPYLAQLLTDPYAATRLVAYRSLQTLPAFADFTYDYVGSATLRGGLADEAVRRWERAGAAAAGAPELLLRADGRPDMERWLDLLRRRDQTPVTIRE
jgi:predicted CXXCH cytochrome family protein